MARSRGGRRGRRGQIIVGYAVMVLVLVAVVGLGCDIGAAYLTRQRLQNAADAAALAAASKVFTGGWAEEGFRYWQRNRGGTWKGSYTGSGTQADPYVNAAGSLNGDVVRQFVTVTDPLLDQRVTVSCTRAVPYAFLALVGRSGTQVTASATARAVRSLTLGYTIVGYNQAPTARTHSVSLSGTGNTYGAWGAAGVYSAQNVCVTGQNNVGWVDYHDTTPPPGNLLAPGVTARAAALRTPDEGPFDRSFWDRPMPPDLEVHEGNWHVKGSLSGAFHVTGDLTVDLKAQSLSGTFYVDGKLTVRGDASQNSVSGYFRAGGDIALSGQLSVNGVFYSGGNLTLDTLGSSFYTASFAADEDIVVTSYQHTFSLYPGAPGNILFYVGFSDTHNNGGAGSGHGIELDANRATLPHSAMVYNPYGHIGYRFGIGARLRLVGDTVSYSGNHGVFEPVVLSGFLQPTVTLVE